MNEPNKHHYVPQVYLRYFAKERKKKEFILYVYDKRQDKTFPRNIKDIGYEKNYNRVHNGKYLPPLPDDNELHYENKFRELIENDWNSIVHKFTATCTLSQQKKILSDDMKFMLAKLIVIQVLRTPYARELTRKVGLKSSKELFDELTPIIKSVPRDDIIKSFSKMKREFTFNEEQTKAFHLFATTNNDRIEEFANMLVQNRIWVVYRSPNKEFFPFVTSDNPVMLYNPISRRYGIGNNGIENNFTIIGFPVTPEYYIISFHKKSPLGDFSIENGDRCVTVESKTVAVLDRHQTNQCFRQVYLPKYLGESLMNNERTQE